MMKCKECVILLVLCVGFAICEETSGKTSSTTTTTVTPSTTETTTLSTTTSTTTPSTTPSTTTPSTTTTSSTTTQPTTTAMPTTPAPVTSTTPAPATQGSWNVTDKQTGKTCILVKMAIKLELNYTGADNTSKTYIHNVPATQPKSIVGSCTNTTQNITVTTDFCTFTIEFAKENNMFEITKFMFDINTAEVPELMNKNITVEYNTKSFATPVDRSYYCTKQQMLVANETIDKVIMKDDAKIIISHVQLEAFHTKTNDFSTAKDCESSDTPDAVPIAVGLSLAALVIVVLIAYLVARRRNASGYTSM